MSLTTILMKFLEDKILPTMVRLHVRFGLVEAVRGIRLSAKLKDSVLEISLSTDWDGSILFSMRTGGYCKGE